MFMILLSMLCMGTFVDAKEDAVQTGGTAVNTVTGVIESAETLSAKSMAELESSFKSECEGTKEVFSCDQNRSEKAIGSVKTAAQAMALSSSSSSATSEVGSAADSSGTVGTVGAVGVGATGVASVTSPIAICDSIRCDVSDEAMNNAKEGAANACGAFQAIPAAGPFISKICKEYAVPMSADADKNDKDDFDNTIIHTGPDECIKEFTIMPPLAPLEGYLQIKICAKLDKQSVQEFLNSLCNKGGELYGAPLSGQIKTCGQTIAMTAPGTVTPFKITARDQEKKCRKLCQSIYYKALSQNTQRTSILPALAGLAGVIVGSNQKTRNPKEREPKDVGAGITDPGSQDSCAGLKDKQLSACICKNNLKLDYDPATDSCVDTSLPAGTNVVDNKPVPTAQSYIASNATKDTADKQPVGAGAVPTKSGVASTKTGIVAAASPDNVGKGGKKKVASNKDKLASQKPSDGVNDPSVTGALGEDEEEKEDEASDQQATPSDIAGKDVNIWEAISKTYQKKYEDKEIQDIIVKKVVKKQKRGSILRNVHKK